ncbi:hypothetical protein Hrd1104_01555 [Halorhabdus sp. CBA1104]|uniref:hypothetical protein n=2 Tax=unclassified Halorhabdus TaxID=2621901 RepID=UPI0012B196CE|nr:hypothetical protein [Halorhabdus sp. CBA1104]QGN06109.1 hypothetical protein Hrd1104_01555 [Halorhabdus sp. CBA1104]
MVSIDDLSHVEYERSGSVGVWRITDFAAYFDSGEIEHGQDHYREEAGKDSMDGTVIVIENAESLGSAIQDSLDHINEEWSKLADDVNIDRLAYVAEGMMSTTVKMKTETDVETESFDSAEEAVEWCQRA